MTRVPGKLTPVRGVYNARIIWHASCKTIFIPKGFCKIVIEGADEGDLVSYESKADGGVVIEVLSNDLPCQNMHGMRRESW